MFSNSTDDSPTEPQVPEIKRRSALIATRGFRKPFPKNSPYQNEPVVAVNPIVAEKKVASPECPKKPEEFRKRIFPFNRVAKKPAGRVKVEERFKGNILIAVVPSLSMGFCPSSWLEPASDYIEAKKALKEISKHRYLQIRDELLKYGNQISRIRLSCVVLAEFFHECQQLTNDKDQTLDICLATHYKANELTSVGRFPNKDIDLSAKVSRFASQSESLLNKYDIQALVSLCCEENEKRKLDKVFIFIDVDTLYSLMEGANLEEILPKITKMISCNFILLVDRLMKEKTSKVKAMLRSVTFDTTSKIIMIRNPTDCMTLSRDLSLMCFKKKKIVYEYHVPHAIQLVFGCLPPINIVARYTHGPKQKYFKPAGANRITIVGFIEDEEHMDGIGFTRIFELIDVFNAKCYQKSRARHNKTDVRRNNILMRMLISNLKEIDAAAFCILDKGKGKFSYGIVKMDDEKNCLILGLIKKSGLGSEVWNYKNEWVNRKEEYVLIPPPVKMRFVTNPGSQWEDARSIQLNVTSKFYLFTHHKISASEFEKIFNGFLSYSKVVGINLTWLEKIIQSHQGDAKSRVIHDVLSECLKKIQNVSDLREDLWKF